MDKEEAKTKQEVITAERSHEVIVKNRTKGIVVALYLMQDLKNVAIYAEDFYIYNGQHWEEISQNTLDRKILSFFTKHEITEYWKPALNNEIKESLRVLPASKIIDKFDNYDNLINLKNGVFNFETKEMMPHSSEYFFSYILDVEYDPEQTSAPTFVQFMKGCFAFEGTWDNDYNSKLNHKDIYKSYDNITIDNILRMCGYLLYPKNIMEKMFVLIGSGRNGKSLLIEVIKSFFPRKYITPLSLGALSNEEGFNRSQLAHSKINIATEQKASKKIDSEELKKIISGESITIQRKFKVPLTFDPTAKIIISSNGIPYFNDTSFGITRRLQMFHFKNRFLSDNEYAEYEWPERQRVFPDKPKQWLLKKFKEEKSAIFNMFIIGLENLKADNWQFIPSVNEKELRREYTEISDVLGLWLMDNYEYGDEYNHTLLSDLVHHFKTWYLDNYPARDIKYSNVGIGRKIKSTFRVESGRVQAWDQSRGISTTKTMYPIKLKGATVPEEVEAFLKPEEDEQKELL